MRGCLSIVAAALLAICAQASSSGQKNAKAARIAYKRALAYEDKKDLAGALSALEEAAQLEPTSAQYQGALAQVRELLVDDYIQKGEQALKNNHPNEATAELRAALALDPTNPTATQDLRSLEPPPSPEEKLLSSVEESGEVLPQPSRRIASFNFSGDSRSVLSNIAQAYGLEADFDDNFPSRAVTLQLENASLAYALDTATKMASAMWVVKSPTEIFFAADSPDKHRQYDRQIFRTFYLSDVSTPQELNEIAVTLRTIFNLRYVVTNATEQSILVRGPQQTMQAATEFLDNLNLVRPQVLLDINAYEISGDLLRNLGVQVPTQYSIINIPPSVIAALNSSNVQNEINQILAGNGNPNDLAALQALLAQLQAQSSGLTQLLNTPFVTFGGGQSLFAVAVPGINVNFQWNQSYIQDLKHVTLRAGNGDTASLLIGTRFPVLTSSFSITALNSGASIPQQGNAAFTTLPSFQYEDLGVTLKAKPQIHLVPVEEGVPPDAAPEVTLGLNMAVRQLGGSSINSVPVINNREYDGSVRLKDNEPALLVGSISVNRQRSRTGLPLLSTAPLIGDLFSTESLNNTEDEILFVITPHIVRAPNATASSTLWLRNSD